MGVKPVIKVACIEIIYNRYYWPICQYWLLLNIYIQSYTSYKCMIEQIDMTFAKYFWYLFSFSSSLLFLGGKRKGKKNNQSRGQKSCLSARSQLINL